MPGSRPTKNERFTLGTAGAMYQDRYWNERSFATVVELQKLAGEAGLPLATLAVAWVMANPVITAPLLGASRPEQLDATLVEVRPEEAAPPGDAKSGAPTPPAAPQAADAEASDESRP